MLIVKSTYMGADWYLTARGAAEALGVSLPTLYAYTSRGQLRSEPADDGSRARRYLKQDVERLLERKEARRDPSKAAARGLHWGSPVLSSSITLIRGGRLYYRGADAVALAETLDLEHLAEFLWDTEIGDRLFKQELPPLPPIDRKESAMLRLQTMLPKAEALDPAACDLRPQAVRQAGVRILRLAAAAVAGRETGLPVHWALQRAWAPKRPAVAQVIRKALVLCADHELNVSAFTARCAASAGASPYDAVGAALATLKGARHGGETERVAALLIEARVKRNPRGVIEGRLRRGERVPGFGHPLYPKGDPRAEFLLRLAQAGADQEQWKLAKGVMRAAGDLLHDRPNLDFGLMALARSHKLPGDAPILLFALGRIVGWIAHAIEQYASGELIRPRANYTGPAPELT
jgi:citrate synthase